MALNELDRHLRICCLAVGLIAFGASCAVADGVFLQLEEIRNPEKDAHERQHVVRSLEAGVSVGRAFYLRNVTAGNQWLLRGVIQQREDKSYTVDFVFTETELRDDPVPRTKLKGRLAIPYEQIKEPQILGHAPEIAGTKYTLAVCPLLEQLGPLDRQIGFIDRTSGFSVRLVDESGATVRGAVAGLYGPTEDSPCEPIIGPAKAEEDGIHRFTECLECLPDLTFHAAHKGRGLEAMANLDRNSISLYDAKTLTRLPCAKV